jgi:hypothetical protein
MQKNGWILSAAARQRRLTKTGFIVVHVDARTGSIISLMMGLSRFIVNVEMLALAGHDVGEDLIPHTFRHRWRVVVQDPAHA